MSTPERRRQRIAQDPEHRERLRAYKRANRLIHKEETNRRRRLKYATDPEYRAKLLVPRPKTVRRKADLKARYGMSLEQYALMCKRQGGACAICGEQPVEALCVDHCHATDKVRGLLCRGCNFGLGHYRDDQRLTMAATAYLRRAALEDEAL